MNDLKTIVSWIWKVALGGALMTLGVMLGGALATALGLEMPRVVAEVGPARQLLLLFVGSTAFAAGLAAMNAGLPGSRGERWLVLALFGFVVNGIGNTLEGSVFSNIGGELAILTMRLPSTLLCAAAVVLLFSVPDGDSLRARASSWFTGWPKLALAVRLGIAFIAFPVIYFAFGMMVTPIVMPYYDALDFLVIPPLPTLLTVLSVRSLLLLLASLPVIAAWNRTRIQLVLALGLGHFVAVGLTDLLQASFFPTVLRWTHSIEILADSMCYALVVAWLLVPRQLRENETAPTLQERHT